jgi:hypothetical protein
MVILLKILKLRTVYLLIINTKITNLDFMFQNFWQKEKHWENQNNKIDPWPPTK